MSDNLGSLKHLSEDAARLPLFAAHIDKFTRSDARIANYIAEHRDMLSTMTISELSASTGVSEITISRFCKKIDKSGLQALKIALAENSSFSSDLPAEDITRNDSVKKIATKIFRNIEIGLNSTLSLLDEKTIENVARIIVNSNRLLVYGYGVAGAICRDISLRFMRFGLQTDYICDPHIQAMASSQITRDTTIIAVSTSGSTMDLVHNIRLAHSRGAKIILLTTHRKSPAASIADEIVLVNAPENEQIYEINVLRFLYVAIADVIYTKVALSIDEETYKENLKCLRTALALFKA